MEKYPEYIISMGASTHCALIDMEKFQKAKDWKPFNPKPIKIKYGFIVYEDKWGYNAFYINGAIKTINPNEYSFYKDYEYQMEEDVVVLTLRNNKYAIIIAPRVFEDEEISYWEKIQWNDFNRKAPKSVFII